MIPQGRQEGPPPPLTSNWRRAPQGHCSGPLTQLFFPPERRKEAGVRGAGRRWGLCRSRVAQAGPRQTRRGPALLPPASVSRGRSGHPGGRPCWYSRGSSSTRSLPARPLRSPGHPFSHRGLCRTPTFLHHVKPLPSCASVCLRPSVSRVSLTPRGHVAMSGDTSGLSQLGALLEP